MKKHAGLDERKQIMRLSRRASLSALCSFVCGCATGHNPYYEQGDPRFGRIDPGQVPGWNPVVPENAVGQEHCRSLGIRIAREITITIPERLELAALSGIPIADNIVRKELDVTLEPMYRNEILWPRYEDISYQYNIGTAIQTLPVYLNEKETKEIVEKLRRAQTVKMFTIIIECEEMTHANRTDVNVFIPIP